MAQPAGPAGGGGPRAEPADGEGPPDALSLEDILRLYNQPINEEQAWAVCYQCCASLRAADAGRRQPRGRLRSAAQIRVWRDGAVTLASGGAGEPPPSAGKLGYSHCTETEVIESLGIVIYKALDYGLKENEERELSPPLEQLIDHMANTVEADGSNDEGYGAADEGLEDEEDEKRKVSAIQSYRDVMKLCAAHLPTESEAPNHYQAVCRALFAETMELHTFLTKIKSAKEEPPYCLPQWLHHFAFPPILYRGSFLSTSLPTRVSLFLILAVLTSVRGYLIVGLICIFLMMSDDDYLFM